MTPTPEESNVKIIGKGQRVKQILHEINGYAKPKEMLAVMGGSGSGKTSLLNVLASRLSLSPGSVFQGEVKVNERVYDNKSFGKVGAFVQQDDILISCMTPREVFIFAATLRTTL